MKPTIFSVRDTAYNVTGLPPMGVMHLSIGDLVTVQWREGDADRHYEVQPDCETLHEVALLKSVAASASGEYASNANYPETAQVHLPLSRWEGVRKFWGMMPANVKAMDITIPETTDTLFDGDGAVLMEDYDDCWQFHCYRLVRSGDGFTPYLVFVAQYHDTQLQYELKGGV
jgi:hypothetical protein